MTWESPPDSALMTHSWNELSPAVETGVSDTGAASVSVDCTGADSTGADSTGAEVCTGADSTGAGASDVGAAGIFAGLAGTVSVCPTWMSFAYWIWLWLAQ